MSASSLARSTRTRPPSAPSRKPASMPAGRSVADRVTECVCPLRCVTSMGTSSRPPRPSRRPPPPPSSENDGRIVEGVDVEQQVRGPVGVGGPLPVGGGHVPQRRPDLAWPNARMRRDVQGGAARDRRRGHGGTRHVSPATVEEGRQDALAGRHDVDIRSVVAEVAERVVGIGGVPRAVVGLARQATGLAVVVGQRRHRDDLVIGTRQARRPHRWIDCPRQRHRSCHRRPRRRWPRAAHRRCASRNRGHPGPGGVPRRSC